MSAESPTIGVKERRMRMKNNTMKTKVSTLIIALSVCLLATALWFMQPVKAEASEVQTVEGFTMEDKAEVRQYHFVGLRFLVNVESGVKGNSNYAGATYGTILIPEDMLDGELTINTANILNIPTSNWQNDEQYTAVLAGKKNAEAEGGYDDLSESYYNRNIVARGYMKVGDTYYYTTNTVTRNIGYVAAMNVKDGKGSDQLNEIASKADVKISSIVPNTDRSLYTNGTSTGYTLLFDGKNSTIKTAVDFFNAQLKALTGSNLGYHGSYNGYNGTDDWSKEPTSWSETDKYIVFGNKADMLNLAEIDTTRAEKLIGHEGYYITTKGNSVFIYANNDEAYQLAAVKLLNVLTGYEMYAADCVTFTSDGKNINIPDMEIIVEPDFDYRNRGNYLSVGGGTYGMGYTNNSIFMSVNGEVYHTALELLDPDTYYNKPLIGSGYASNSWFRYWDADSGWFTKYALYQLCYTTILENKTVTVNSKQVAPMDIIYDNLKATILANPTLENISFGPADNPYTCDCSACQTAGAVNSYVKVANALADRLAADTDLNGRTVNLVIFAYRAHETAPTEEGLKLHENVAVMIAPIEANWSKPLRSQTNVANNIKAWSALTDNMYFWFYQTNFDYYLYPLNSWGVMADNIRFANQNGAKYLFNQGASDKNVSHFSKLKDYVESKLMVDSSLNYNTLVDNFFNAYYGAGAEEMKAYFIALQTHMNKFTSSTGGYKEAIATTANWPQATLQSFMEHINNAASKVESGSTYASHIKLESLFPRYALLSLYEDETTAGSKAAFMTDCDAFEIVNLCEGTTLESELASWRHDHKYNVQNPVAENLASEATCSSSATYYYTCSCGLKGTATFTYGSTADHSYTFAAGEGENEGYDVGTCTGNCGATVKVKTNYTNGTPVDIINGTEATLTMPSDFVGTVTGVKFGSQDVGYTYGKINTTSIQQASHGTWAAIEVTFTSSYGGTHTAKVPVTLITEVITTYEQFEAFAKAANTANTSSTAMHGYYILGADIDCTGKTLTTSGGGWNQGFFGTFDGRGYKISNLVASNQGGIFGRLAGTVKNVHFENVAFAANTALFGKICAGATFTDVTVDIGSWVSNSGNMTYAGILGVSQNLNNKFDNFVINVANGVSVSNLMGAHFTGTGDITVNLHGTASVVNYYTDTSSNAVTSAEGTIITVNTIEYNNYTVSDAYTAESNSTLTLTNPAFTNGASATVGGQTVTVSNNSVTFSTSALTVGENNNVIVAIGNDTWTYDNIFCVIKILTTVEDLAHLNVGNTSHVKNGYYILGNDIDCNGASIGGASTTNSNSHNLWGNGFTGTFDGRGYAIKNATTTGYGIFGAIDGTIKNVKFEQITFAANASLFARTIGQSSQATFEDVTIDIVGWSASSTDAAIFGRSRNNKVAFSNVEINVADGLTITKLFGGLNDSSNTANITGNVTVNLGAGSTISLYFADATKPGFVTVNQDEVYVPVEETHDELVAAEGTTSLTISNALLTAGNASVSVNGGAASTVAVTAAGQITIDITGQTMGKLENGIVITTPKGDTLTYTEVWYVTQVIDDATELKALGAACKAANTTGYYILGGNIDCSAEANMAAGNPGWQLNGFSGTFDGRGYTISNIKMTWDSATNGYGGLFGNLAGCTIKNVVFDNVNYASANVALLGRHSYASGGNNVTLENLTINISAWGATGEAGLFVSRGTLNTIHNNCIVNVADGLTIHNLLGQEWKSNYGTGITVNLGNGSTITSYYYADTVTAQTTPPSIMTVNAAQAPVVETLDTLVAGENSTSVTFTHNAFADSTSATVVINGVTKENVAISDGTLTLDLADYGVSEMKQYSAVITTNHNDVITFTEVWYVTQVIDDATELNALGTLCKDSVVTGYYILGGYIDCSAYATMSNGSGSTTANGFAGTFNGRGKTISNIKMTWDNATGGLGGLFGKLLGCTIENTIFDNVNLGTNGTLLASGSAAYNGSNVNLKGITINLTGYSTVYGVVVGYGMLNTIANGLTINVADGLTVAALLCRDNCNSIAYIYATVNLGTGSSITNYYSGATNTPGTFTVTQE